MISKHKSQNTISLVNSIISEHSLNADFSLLYNKTKGIPQNIGFPDQIQMVAKGFKQFCHRKSIGLFLKKTTREICELTRFLLTLTHALSVLEKPEDKAHLLKQFRI